MRYELTSNINSKSPLFCPPFLPWQPHRKPRFCHMLATNTYCFSTHGDHSHPPLDLGKSYSRFTPLFLALHKSSPSPVSCVMRYMREGAKTVKGDTTSKQMKCKPNENEKPNIWFLFHTKKYVSSRESGFECTDQECCSRFLDGTW